MNEFYQKINITELSRLTNKTRPSIYKYIDQYLTGNINEIPHSFVVLFNKINDDENKEEIIKYCESNFLKVTNNDSLNNIILLLRNNYQKIDLPNLENHIKELIK